MAILAYVLIEAEVSQLRPVQETLRQFSSPGVHRERHPHAGVPVRDGSLSACVSVS